jgi:hypothetical protein
VSQPTFTWTPTAQDYERALRLWRDASGAAARTRMIGATLMAFGFVVTVFTLTVLRAASLAFIPLVGVMGIGLVWYLDLPSRWGLRGAVARTPAMLQPTTVTVETDGLHVANPSGRDILPWSALAAHVESDELMLVGLSLDSPAVSGILSRSATTGGSAWDTAANRVRTHVPVHPRIAHLRERRATGT